jgi:hypothetical protein
VADFRADTATVGARGEAIHRSLWRGRFPGGYRDGDRFRPGGRSSTVTCRVDTVKSMRVNPTHCMGDTRRGRERKGRVKREQRRRQEIERAKEYVRNGDDADFDELYEDVDDVEF